MADITFEEIEHALPARRWLYRLSVPVRFTTGLEGYATGKEQTRYVIVSWGRDGDTCIFPSYSEGRILDMLGWNGRMGWDEPEARLREWIDGAAYGMGDGSTFAEVAVTDLFEAMGLPPVSFPSSGVSS